MPLKRIVVAILFLVSVVVTTTSATSSSSSAVVVGTTNEVSKQQQRHRSLEDEAGNDQDNNNNNNGDGDDSDDDKNFFVKAWDRIFGDMEDMWATSPSTWITEYWEVFAVLAVLTFLVLACHTYMFCDICCFGASNHSEVQGGRVVTTQAELDEKKKKELELGEPILKDLDPDADDTDGGASPRSSPETTTTDAAEQTGDESKPRSRSSAKSKRTRARQGGARRKIDLATEVVSVWSEFIKEGFNGTFGDNEAEQRYQKYKEEKKKRTSSASRRKRGSSVGKQGGSSSNRSASVVVKEPTAATTTVAQGDIV